MNLGSDPADQIVRYSLAGTEVALKLSGLAAKINKNRGISTTRFSRAAYFSSSSMRKSALKYGRDATQSQ